MRPMKGYFKCEECGTEFVVVYEHEARTVEYCPSCGHTSLVTIRSL